MIIKYLKSGYQKVKNAFSQAGSLLGGKIRSLFKKGNLNEDTLEQLEQLFYESDFGVQTSVSMTKKVQLLLKENPAMKSEELIAAMQAEVFTLLSKYPAQLIEVPPTDGPMVILIVGVNGNGKTTSVAKLAKKLTMDGKKVILAAADTFRAAATEQLEIWAERLNIGIVKGTSKSDPAAVVFDAVSAGKARGVDVVIIDTAGRLHTKTALMQELEKMKRSCKKLIPNSPHETLLVLDASTGQNAIDQAKTFNQFTPITGLILTKLDGTAKGGIVLSIQQELGIPVKFIGVGESVDDFEQFDPESFSAALFE